MYTYILYRLQAHIFTHIYLLPSVLNTVQQMRYEAGNITLIKYFKSY